MCSTVEAHRESCFWRVRCVFVVTDSCDDREIDEPKRAAPDERALLEGEGRERRGKRDGGLLFADTRECADFHRRRKVHAPATSDVASARRPCRDDVGPLRRAASSR